MSPNSAFKPNSFAPQTVWQKELPRCLLRYTSCPWQLVVTLLRR